MAFTRSTCFVVRTMSSQMQFVGTYPLTRNYAVEHSQMILGMSICKTPLWTMIYNIRYFTLSNANLTNSGNISISFSLRILPSHIQSLLHCNDNESLVLCSVII